MDTAKAIFDAAPEMPAAAAAEQPKTAKAIFDSVPEDPGKLAALAEGAGQGATLGFADEIEGGYKALAKKILPKSLGGTDLAMAEQYLIDRDAARGRAAAAEKTHPAMFKVGELAGGIVPALAMPGGAFATIPRAIATGAAMGAVGGAGGSTAEDLAGVGIDALKGAAAGGAAGGAGAGAQKLIGAAVQPLANRARELAASTVKGTAGQYGKLGREEVQNLGDWLLRNKAVRAGDTFENIAPRVDALRSTAGAAKGAAEQELEQLGARVNAHDLAQRLMDRAQEEELRGPGARSIVDHLLREAAAVEDAAAKAGSPNLPLSKAELWKKAYQDLAYPKGIPSPEPTALQIGQRAVAGEVREGVDQAAESAAKRAGSDVFDRFSRAKKDYGASATVDKLLEGAEGRALARNIAGPSDKAAAGAALLATHGNPVAGAAVGLVNNQVRTRAASTLAVGAQGMSKLMRITTQKPGRLGKYASILTSALRESPETFNAHSYVLGQTDPEFQDLQKSLNEEGD